MKRKVYLVLLVFWSFIEVSYPAAPPIMDWQKCLGGTLQDLPSALIRSKDEDIILLSNVDSNNGDVLYNHGSTDIWITKLDVSGKIIWQKTIGGSSIDVATGISELQNGNLVISGYTSSSNGDFLTNKGSFDIFLLCTDAQGNILWTKIYGGSLVDLCYSQLRTDDGGFILGGSSYSSDGDVTNNHGDQDLWILKTDSVGNILWQQSVGGSAIDICFSLSKD